MPQQLVILTDKKDAHVPFVQRHLRGDVIIIDPQDLAQGSPLSLEETAKGTVVWYENTLLDSVSGVWYRKPQPVHDQVLPVPDELRDYCRSAIERQYMLLQAAFPAARYVSDYYAALRASNKLLQLQLARQLGFTIPDTVFSGSADVVLEFVDKHPKSITKRLADAVPVIGGKRALFMTSQMTQAEAPNLENLHLAPAIFQQAVEAKRDIRVTVVGERAFPAYVHSPPHKTATHVRDSRIGNFDGSITIQEATDFPADIAERCISLTKHLGLQFSAIDLVEDIHGVIWFIECNAGGQWAYIEQATGLPIGKAIADLLMSGNK